MQHIFINAGVSAQTQWLQRKGYTVQCSTPSLEKEPFSQTWPKANEGLLIETLESSTIHKYSFRKMICMHKRLLFLTNINILFPFSVPLKARVIFKTLKKVIYGNKRKLFCEHVWFSSILCACLFWYNNMIYFINMPIFTEWVIVNVETSWIIHPSINILIFLFFLCTFIIILKGY